ncbi:tetratricopeptide repeat protein [Roseivirga sp.]|uniref:tetratricopeptide repeat protein n=1 Tax=Roseivirga sp. TaxID=1964215 RepID=UPI003B8CA5F6
MKQILTLVLIALLSPLSIAQDLKQSAQKNFQEQSWQAASKDYLAHLKTDATDSSDWYNLAISQYHLSKYKNAIKYFREAKDRNFAAPNIFIGISRSYAKLNDSKALLTTLSEAAENGLAAYALLKSDPVFEPYLKYPDFKAILEKVSLNAYPCLSQPNYRHFDFWLGEWDVFVGNRKVGENSITMAQGGCAIHENYKTVGNYAGQSINFYDPIDKKWHQHWVGSGGDVYNYLETKREEGLLQFESKFMGPNGNISLSRLTFTLKENGTVKQLFENSRDEGKTWTPSFDGIYKKK